MTDRGLQRGNNEDALWVDPEKDLIVVADGMGGHRSGEKASGIAVSAIPEHFRKLSRDGTPGEILDEHLSIESNRLGTCVKMANRAIYEASLNNPKDRGMGTTCTAVYFHGERMSLAHVGDTRCYMVRRGQIRQLTRDHSWVMEQVRLGLMTPEEIPNHNPNILTRALGTEATVEIDVEEHPILPGDTFVLCSDGLNKEVTDEQILEVVERSQEPAAIVRRLIAMANAGGGRDNVTVAAVHVDKAGFGTSLKSLFGAKQRRRSPDA
jgi:protein phosphatase